MAQDDLVLLLVNAVFLFVVALGLVDDPSEGCPPPPNDICVYGRETERLVALMGIIAVWFSVVAFLFLVWLVTPQRRASVAHER